MAANATELVILKGYAVTGVTLASQQEVFTKGYGPGAAPPAGVDPDPTCLFGATANTGRFGAEVTCG